MAPSVRPEDMVLFYWTGSPWASKVTTYLTLRNLPHAECEQPITLPRPDIKALGLNYRRIPVLAIGRDIYCDTLLILEKLETLFPADGTTDEHGGGKALGATTGSDMALEKLLEKWTDVVVFKPAADAIPSSVPLLKDPKFVKDRTELWGRDWSAEAQDKLRPAGLSNLLANFAFLEAVLADGREWLLGGDAGGPRLADIHAAWIFSWMLSLPDGLPESHFSTTQFPKTRAWLSRYDRAVAAATSATETSTTKLSSEKALTKCLRGDFVDDVSRLEVIDDPLGLEMGQEVEVFPIDTGSGHRDRGRLIALTVAEVVLERRAPSGEGVRLHYPRWNFAVVPVAKREEVEEGVKLDISEGDDDFFAAVRPQLGRMKSSKEFGHHDI